MSAAAWGALLGLTASAAGWLVVARVAAIRRPQLAERVLPYVPELRGSRAVVTGSADGVPWWRGRLRAAGGLVEQTLGGNLSIERRLARLGSPMSRSDFRVEQVLWGLIGIGAVALLVVLRSLTAPVSPVATLLLIAASFATGVVGRDTWLTSQVGRREQRIAEELPALAELMALSVAAGETTIAALDRVVRRSRGDLADELAAVLAAVRTGTPVIAALDDLARRTGLPVLARFAHGLAVAVERGTPVTDVLHAQAADVRESSRRSLIESAARREVLMLVPVVFLVLPTVVLFAFFPGAVGLSLTAP